MPDLEKTIDIISHMQAIHNRLNKAVEYGLEVEVITFALEAMKSDPTLSLSQAFECGCRDWDV